MNFVEKNNGSIITENIYANNIYSGTTDLTGLFVKIPTFPENPNHGDVYISNESVYTYDDNVVDWILRPNAIKKYTKKYFLATKSKNNLGTNEDINHHPELSKYVYESRFMYSFCEIYDIGNTLLTNIRCKLDDGVPEWMRNNILDTDTNLFTSDIYLYFYDIVDSDLNLTNGRFGNPLYGSFKGRDKYLKKMVGINSLLTITVSGYDSFIQALYDYFYNNKTANITNDVIWYTNNKNGLYNQPLIGSNVKCDSIERLVYDPISDSMTDATNKSFQVGESVIITTDFLNNSININFELEKIETMLLKNKLYAIIAYQLINTVDGTRSFYIKPIGVNTISFYTDTTNCEIVAIKESDNVNPRYMLCPTTTDTVQTRINIYDILSTSDTKNVFDSSFIKKIKFFKREIYTGIKSEISKSYFKYNGRKNNILACYVGSKD